MEHTQSISPNVDELLLEASLIYESGNTSNSEEQWSMETTPKCRFANPVTLEYLKEKVKKQYARQNQAANRLECCFADGMVFKPN